MSGGAPYPRPVPAPGSNAIGSFEIGVSPIGTINSFDIWSTVISQYANSDVLMSIITSFTAAMDLTQDFDDFYDKVWNILTAVGWGLDVWGNILGVRRTFQQIPTTRNFGYQEATVANADPFNVSPF